MTSAKKDKTIRQLKERAAEIRRQGKVSIPRSLELAAREHGFADFEAARGEISAYRALLLQDTPTQD
jgi:hypothetical protein